MNTLLRSNEFSCPSCVSKIESTLQALPGVNAAKVQFNTGKIEIDHEEKVSADALVQAVADAGYKARVAQF